MIYKFFDKNYRDTNDHNEAGTISEDQELAAELHNSITRKIHAKYTCLIEITFGVLILQHAGNKQMQ